MNRHDRRRRARELREFHGEAGGALKTIILRAALATLAFLAGDDLIARAFRPAVKEFHRDLSAHDCLFCRATFSDDRPPVDWVMLLPLFGTPKLTLLSAICETCSDRHPDNTELFHVAGAVFKAGMWPDLRLIDPAAVSAESGRA